VKGLRYLVKEEAGQNKERYAIILLALFALLVGVLILTGVSFRDVSGWLNRLEAMFR
jgi:hypothetical protein